VTAKDDAGNESVPRVITGAIDTNAPTIIGAPVVEGAPITNNTQPAITGSDCTDGDTIKAYIDGVAITPTAVCTGGTYSIIPDTLMGNVFIKLPLLQPMLLIMNQKNQLKPM
jgi:hypothetical protein